MGIKIGKNTLLAGNTVLNTGEQVNVSRAAAGDAKAPLAMAVTSSDNSPAYDPTWLNDDNGIVNVAMVKKLIELLAAGGMTEELVDALINGHNKNTGAHSNQFNGKLNLSHDTDQFAHRTLLLGKMDIPSGGVAGQVLQKTSSGYQWASMSAGTWNGGNVSNATTFQKDVTIGSASYSAWVRMANTNAGAGWSSIPGEALPTKNQIDGKKLNKPTSGNIGNVLILGADGPQWGAYSPGTGKCEYPYHGVATYYDPAGTPGELGFQDFMPRGWYKVDVLLKSSSGANAGGLLSQSVINSGRIKNVQGIAFAGSAVYASFDGLNWLAPNGDPVGSITCHLVQISFLYHFTSGLYSVDWRGTALTSGPGWSIGSSRYTYVQMGPDDRRYVTTQVPTDAPTMPPTNPPTEGETTLIPSDGPTEPPTEVTTEVPTEGPTDVPTDIETEPPVEAPAYFRLTSSDEIQVPMSGHFGNDVNEYGIRVETNMDEWSVEYGLGNWCTMSPSGGALYGSGIIGYLQVYANSGDYRETIHTFRGKRRSTGETIEFHVKIMQAKAETTLVPTEAPKQIPQN